MDATESTWRASALIDRILVVAQTVAWAVGTVFIRFVSRPARGVPAWSVGSLLAILSVAGVGAGLLVYARGPKADVAAKRGTAILTWLCLHIAGLLAWFGYVSSGEGRCFVAGVIALVLLHAFSPGRLRNLGPTR